MIRMLTNAGDLVVDPFAGSCVTGEVCERTMRRWVCVELLHDYCEAALGRFVRDPRTTAKSTVNPEDPSNYYRLPRFGMLWNGEDDDWLPEDGGKHRRLKRKETWIGESEHPEPVSVDCGASASLAGCSLRQGDLDYR